MKGFKPMIKMAKGGLVPTMPKLPKAPKSLAGPKGPTGPRAANQAKGVSAPKPVAFKKGGHVDEAADIALIKKEVKASCLKTDKKFGK